MFNPHNSLMQVVVVKKLGLWEIYNLLRVTMSSHWQCEDSFHIW